MIKLKWPHAEHIPPCICDPGNPNRSEDLMLWTLGHCNPRERQRMLHAWRIGDSIPAAQADEMEMIAGMRGESDG